MKPILVSLLILLCSSAASAAQIYGSLKEDGRAVGQGAQVEIQYTGGPAQGATDAYGSYNLYVRPPGKCTLRVLYKGAWVQTEINSYNDPVRYDFDLVRQSNGNYSLR